MKLTVMAGDNGDTCLVYVMRQFVMMRGYQPGYVFLEHNGVVADSNWLSQHIDALMGAMQLDRAYYNTHNFRIGACMHWAQQGASVTEILIKARWHSYAFLKYIRPGDICFWPVRGHGW